TDFSKPINSSLVDFEITDSMSMELEASETELFSEIDPTNEQGLQISDAYMSMELATSETELSSEINPTDEQDLQILVGDSYNSLTVNDDSEVRQRTFECTYS
ncbi:3358_t:CDS:2, partial [Racocetra persica]